MICYTTIIHRRESPLSRIAIGMLLAALVALSIGYSQQRQQLADDRKDIEGLARQLGGPQGIRGEIDLREIPERRYRVSPSFPPGPASARENGFSLPAPQ